MADLSFQRCFNHADREAAARCPECGRFFCRECVTEHDNRVLCAACLKQLVRVPLLRRPALVAVFRVAQCAFGAVLAWFFFFVVGQTLARLPESFHENTLWKVPWIDSE